MSQKQISGDGSVNVQGGTVNYVTVAGVSAADVHDLAKKVFEDNFPRLAEKASQLAISRADELVREFVSTAASKGGNLSAIADPDFQYSLLAAQRDFARSGSEELKTLLAELLVERSLADGQLEKVVIAESLETVRKLTYRQISALSLAWLLTGTVMETVNSIEGFLGEAKKHFEPFIGSLPRNNSEYLHIQYSGCATLDYPSPLGAVVRRQVPGLFQRGFSENAVPEALWGQTVREKLFEKCFHDPPLWQIRAMDERSARRLIASVDLAAHMDLYVGYLSSYELSDSQIEAWLIAQGDFWPTLVDLWKNTSISRMFISSVGMAIGHANWSAVVGGESPLSDWISEIAPEYPIRSER
ncbi:LPO_1073/Vpar_1526 family protein [Amycolatopsis sp. cmx-8-4]|uniref:LPO_1073/Vpar_1526 family protein n=1 Tax=Amycolatopsis sp. cmx-8-4 TaxID=2790947 RepID=UPI003979289F